MKTHRFVVYVSKRWSHTCVLVLGVADISGGHTAAIFRAADASTVLHRGARNAHQFVYDANNRNTQEKDQFKQWATVKSNLNFTQDFKSVGIKMEDCYSIIQTGHCTYHTVNNKKKPTFYPHWALLQFYGYRNKERLFPCRAVTVSITEAVCVYCVVGSEYVIKVISVFYNGFRVISRGVKRPKRGVNHPPPYSAKVKKE